MGPHRERDDRELWLRSASDPEAFGALFERHAQAVYAFCCWRTGDWSASEDLTSATFLEAWSHRRSVTLTGTSVLPWLLGVANNLARNSARSRGRHRAAVRRLPPPPSAPSSEDEEMRRLDGGGTPGDAVGILAGLSDPEREIVLLVFWSGLSYEEAAEALGVPIGTVRSRVSRTRAKVQRMLGPDELELNAEER